MASRTRVSAGLRAGWFLALALAVVLGAPPASAEVGDLAIDTCYVEPSPGDNPLGCTDTEGFDAGWEMEISSDGRSVFAAGVHALSYFDRDPATGRLTFRGCFEGMDSPYDAPCHQVAGLASDVGGVVTGNLEGVDVTGDGRTVSVASFAADAVAYFSRDPSTRTLTYGGCFQGSHRPAGECGSQVPGLDGPVALDSSPDGETLVAVSTLHAGAVTTNDGSLTYFNRNPVTRALSWRGCFEDAGAAGAACPELANGVFQPSDLRFAPDDKSLYVSSEAASTLTHLTRDDTGALAFSECLEETGYGTPCADVKGLESPVALDVAPDGKSVHAAGSGGGELFNFSRATDGALTFDSCFEDPARDFYGAHCADVGGLWDANEVHVSADSRSVYVASWMRSALVDFARDPADGSLTVASCREEPGDVTDHPGCAEVEGFFNPTAIATSPAADSTYLMTYGFDYLIHFTRQSAPETTITGGPGHGSVIADPSPSFEFASDGLATFECRMSGSGAFSPCSSPESIGPLDDGEYTFEVRAIDSLEPHATDPTPATRTFTVDAPDVDKPSGTVTEKGKSKAGKPVKLTVVSDEDGTATARGTQNQTTAGADASLSLSVWAAKKRRFIKVTLKTVRKQLTANTPATLKLKPKGEKNQKRARQLKRLVNKQGAKAKAKITVVFRDEAGNRSKKKLKLKLR
ncbi:MAG TPA: hypothetical protein VD790_13310 [Thermoleophilaceae bacterium]|nr:hypothetical protein [Thermoleophilaceae bacterium]